MKFFKWIVLFLIFPNIGFATTYVNSVATMIASTPAPYDGQQFYIQTPVTNQSQNWVYSAANGNFNNFNTNNGTITQTATPMATATPTNTELIIQYASPTATIVINANTLINGNQNVNGTGNYEGPITITSNVGAGWLQLNTTSGNENINAENSLILSSSNQWLEYLGDDGVFLGENNGVTGIMGVFNSGVTTSVPLTVSGDITASGIIQGDSIIGTVNLGAPAINASDYFLAQETPGISVISGNQPITLNGGLAVGVGPTYTPIPGAELIIPQVTVIETPGTYDVSVPSDILYAEVQLNGGGGGGNVDGLYTATPSPGGNSSFGDMAEAFGGSGARPVDTPATGGSATIYSGEGVALSGEPGGPWGGAVSVASGNGGSSPFIGAGSSVANYETISQSSLIPGAGGAGSGGYNTSGGGSGGGGGGGLEYLYICTPGATIPVTVGSGGLGAICNTGPGSSGGPGIAIIKWHAQ